MLETIGGLGLFLLGMVIMTDGLRALAGHRIRIALMRFTHTPLSGAITGATTTAILQSSSATTVAVIGFVGAGMMNFSSALGIIFGANIGTTITGWLVVLLGFRFKLGLLVLPILLLAALLKLFGNERLSRLGYTVAGFCLIFIGISYMQLGMSEYQQLLLPETFAADTLQSKLKLVLLGMIFTALTQSSSAGVAVALAALFSGAIHFQQAASLVIGMDIGTTITAAIATIGGSTETKRTGYSHVIFNLFAASGALLLLPLYSQLLSINDSSFLEHSPGIALVGFHSLFNLLGVIIVLPFTRQFARLMQRIIPDKGPHYTQNLDPALLQEPSLAINATRTTIQTLFTDCLIHINVLMGDTYPSKPIRLYDIERAIDDTRDYINSINLGAEKTAEREMLIELIHSLDHLQRLSRRCREIRRIQTIRNYSLLEKDRREMIISNAAIIHEMDNQNWPDVRDQAVTCSQQIEAQVKPLRTRIMEDIASGTIDMYLANEHLEAIRWLDRVSDHIERIAYHLSKDTLVPATE